MRGEDLRDEIESGGAASDPQRVSVPYNHPPIDWISAVRASVNEDWFTTGVAEYLGDP